MSIVASLREEKHYSDLSKRRRLFLLILVSVGSSAIYTPIYLKSVFYDPLMQALNCTNEQLGTLVTVYAIAATAFYFFSGIVVDKVHVRTLSWVGYLGTALLTLIYAFLPSYDILLVVFFCYAIFSILIWWGTRFKLVRLICAEDEYSKKIGQSYGIFGAAGLVLGVVAIPIVSSFASAALGIQTLLLVNFVIQIILAALAFFTIPRFKGELSDGLSETFSLKGIGDALKNPGVWWASLAMFFIYFVFQGSTFTTPYMTMCLAAPVVLATVVSTIRTMGMTIVSAPLFGWLAERAKSPSKVIIAGSVVVVVCLAAMALLPQEAGMLTVGIILICVFAFVANGMYGIGSGQLAETHVPVYVFGTAAGLSSIIGRLPDTFIHTWFGVMIDEKGTAAFGEIFVILGICSLASLFCSLMVIRCARKNAALAEQTEDSKHLESAEPVREE